MTSSLRGCAVMLCALFSTGATACSTPRPQASAAEFTTVSVRRTFGGHSSTRTTLRYEGRVITDDLVDLAVDPARRHRALVASQAAGMCGTFVVDMQRGTTWQISGRPMVVHPLADDAADRKGAMPWSACGRYVYAGNDIGHPRVYDVEARSIIDLTDAVSRRGTRLEMLATVWSPDGSRLAVEVAPNGYNGGRDLLGITLASLDVAYVGSMEGALPLWTTRDYGWEGDALLTTGSGVHAPILRRQPADVIWDDSAPLAGPSDTSGECTKDQQR